MNPDSRNGSEPDIPAVWEDLAERLACPQGLEMARLLQATGLLGNSDEGGTPAPASPARRAAERNTPRSARDQRRVCLIGESAAAGFYLAPWLTPAKVLSEQLSRFAPFEVIDQARPGMLLDELVQTTIEALETSPDLLVVFAGNNWIGLGPRPHLYADRYLEAFQDFADSIRQFGVGGLRRLGDERMRSRARRAVDRVAALAAPAGVPVIFVVPAVNLLDFESLHPVPWLPGDGVDRWYALYAQVLTSLAGKGGGKAVATAREMIALDGGECATSHRLLATALLAEGRSKEAYIPLQAHLDTSCWDERFGRGSSAPTVVCRELLAGCRRHGLTAVNLASHFAQLTGSPLTDRRLFLDHCHLTAEGIQAGMAAVAVEVLRLCGLEAPDWQCLAKAEATGMPREVAGLSKLHAGLYNAHMNRPATGGQPPLAEALFGEALDEIPALSETMRDYIEAMTAPGRAFLTAACARNQVSSYPLQPLAWLPSDLGIDALEPMCRALESHGLPIGDYLDRRLLEHHAVDKGGLDIALPKYRERDAGASISYVLRQPAPTIFRAHWPTSVFYLVTNGSWDLRVNLSLRLPASRAVTGYGSVKVSLNGGSVGDVRVGGTWTGYDLKLERSQLRPGLNRLSLSWPGLGSVGNQALQTAIHRLRQGLPADVYPVFGEVFSLQTELVLDA